jgi:hypothetical protein
VRRVHGQWTDVPQFDVADKNTFELTLFPDGRVTFSYHATNLLAHSRRSRQHRGRRRVGRDRGPVNVANDLSRSIGESFRLESDIDLTAVAAPSQGFGDDYQLIVYTNRAYIRSSLGAFAHESAVNSIVESARLTSTTAAVRLGAHARVSCDGLLQQVLAEPHRPCAARGDDSFGFGPRGGPSITRHRALQRQQRFERRTAGAATGAWFRAPSGSHDREQIRTWAWRGPDLTSQRFGPLDQYLMGFRSAEEVPPFFFIRNPIADGAQTAERAPESNVDIRGVKKDVTIADVIAAMGPRSPAPSPNPAPWRLAFLYVTDGSTENGDGAALVDSIRSQFESYFGAFDRRPFLD